MPLCCADCQGPMDREDAEKCSDCQIKLCDWCMKTHDCTPEPLEDDDG